MGEKEREVKGQSVCRGSKGRREKKKMFRDNESERAVSE